MVRITPRLQIWDGGCCTLPFLPQDSTAVGVGNLSRLTLISRPRDLQPALYPGELNGVARKMVSDWIV